MFPTEELPMPTRTLLNVDYYRNLFLFDMNIFFIVVAKNDFETALRAELSDLVKEVETRIWAADAKDWTLLSAKLLVAMGLPDRTTDWRMSKLPNSEDQQGYVQSTEQMLASNSILMSFDPFRNNDRRHFIHFRELNANRTQLQRISDICALMKKHKQLVTVIAETPIFNSGLNLRNPNQLQPMSNYAPILGVDEIMPFDNNSNVSYCPFFSVF